MALRNLKMYAPVSGIAIRSLVKSPSRPILLPVGLPTPASPIMPKAAGNGITVVADPMALAEATNGPSSDTISWSVQSGRAAQMLAIKSRRLRSAPPHCPFGLRKRIVNGGLVTIGVSATDTWNRQQVLMFLFRKSPQKARASTKIPIAKRQDSLGMRVANAVRNCEILLFTTRLAS